MISDNVRKIRRNSHGLDRIVKICLYHFAKPFIGCIRISGVYEYQAYRNIGCIGISGVSSIIYPAYNIEWRLADYSF